MSEKRRGLGRGLGALIPNGLDGQRTSDAQRPVDVFFPDNRGSAPADADLPPDPVTRPVSRGTSPAATTPVAVATDLDEGTDGVSSVEDAGTSPATSPGASAGTETGAQALVSAADDGASTEIAEPGSAPSRSGRRPAGPTEDLIPVPGARFAELPVDSIGPNPRQPRTVFEEEALEELVASIREVGVLQPVVVRPVGDGKYELIMGERRWRATQAAGMSVIPAIVRDTEDSDLLRDALLENLHRSQLNPLEEAAAYQQLLDDFGCTHEELATRIHRSRPQISNTLRLLRLPPLVQRRVAAGVISAGHARALLGLADGAAIERLAQRIVSEGLSVRAVEEIVALGGDAEGPAARRRPKAGERNEALDELASRLSDRFETRVKINLGKARGRLTVEFASVQDLNRILESLAPEDPGLLKP
ncbi:ParB/RepB/Spo0J family partition protein [Cellulomonas cellasea]|uniref:ParB family chromosome partitioning protein n=1 Tax=Cellulomonas cellasea TaxID=43670 RepID=A0A7W4YCP3_9CELL|nr:ParB/RepB/Spo0J family partition protein [Cellulomonas cellasea]MBB2925225.1 ParB family chromosome partitioning protein [Cellulomonas cellasea]